MSFNQLVPRSSRGRPTIKSSTYGVLPKYRFAIKPHFCQKTGWDMLSAGAFAWAFGGEG